MMPVGKSIRRRRPKPVRLPSKCIFNNHLLMDVFYCKDITGLSFSFLNMIDDATGFPGRFMFGFLRGHRHAKPWSGTSWLHGLHGPDSPTLYIHDLGQEFMAAFSSYAKQFGVEVETEHFMRCSPRASQGPGRHDPGRFHVLPMPKLFSNGFPRLSSHWWGVAKTWSFGGSLRSTINPFQVTSDPRSVAQIRLDTGSRVRQALLLKSTGAHFQLEAVCIPATSSSSRKPATPSMVWPCKIHWFRTSRASPTCRLRWDAKWRWPTPKLLASLWLNCGLGDGWATAFCKWGRANCSPYKSSRIRVPLLYKINYKMVLMTNLRQLLWLQELH